MVSVSYKNIKLPTNELFKEIFKISYLMFNEIVKLPKNKVSFINDLLLNLALKKIILINGELNETKDNACFVFVKDFGEKRIKNQRIVDLNLKIVELNEDRKMMAEFIKNKKDNYKLSPIFFQNLKEDQYVCFNHPFIKRAKIDRK